MKLISSIKVDNVKYIVKQVAKLLDEEGNEILGCVDFHNAIITINRKASDDNLLTTLLHELAHAQFNERTIEECVKNGCMEAIIDEISKSWLQIIRDNPDLIAMIQEQHNQTKPKNKTKKKEGKL